MSNKSVNKWLQLMNIPFQMGVIIIGFSFFGSYLDEKLITENQFYTLIFTLFGVGLSLYNVIRQLNQINSKK